MNKSIRSLALVLGFLVASVSLADTSAETDVEVLTTLLHEFLATSSESDTHERFWADDLIYTSSNGTRFGKADILAGIKAGEDAEEDEEPGAVYTGEDVQIQVYGDTAVVAFRLVGTPSDGSAVQYYFNTGTFLKRAGEWRAVAWQATIIPPT